MSDTAAHAKKKSPSQRFSRKENIFYIRLTVILVIAYMLVVESNNVVQAKWSYLYLALLMGTNLLLSRLPLHYFYQKRFYYLLVGFDTLMIALGIAFTGQADSYFFVVYFLIIGISAMSTNLRYLMLNTFMFIIIYGWILYMTGKFQGGEAAAYALRLPFIWTFALLIGYVIECVIQDVNKSIGDLQAKYNSLVQSINSPIFMLDTEGYFIYANYKMLSSINKTEEQVLNRHFSELHTTEESNLFLTNLEHVLDRDEATQFISYSQAKEQWFLNTLSPVKEFTSNAIEAASAVCKDITENVQSERALREAYDRLKRTQDQLIQKNRMEAVGRMASGIAHQLRNPLEIIFLGVEFLEANTANMKKEHQQSIEKIKSATQRANKIIDDVMQITRSSDISFEAINIGQLLQEAVQSLQHRLDQSNTRVETDFNDPDLWVQGNRTTLQQVFLNIMHNAVEAMGDNGLLTLRVYTQAVSSVEVSGKTRTARSNGASSYYWRHNRRNGLLRLKQALYRSREKQGKLMILLADFRGISTQTGQEFAEIDQQSEQTLERRFKQSIRGHDSITRITPNIFLCLIHDLPDEQATAQIAERLHQTLTVPFFSAQGTLQPYVSLGYAVYPEEGSDIKTLLKQAKSALDTARGNNRQIIGPYSGLTEDPGQENLASLPTTDTSDQKSSSPSSWVVVEVQDNGPGMSEEMASRIFDPFYTTKQADKGTGLGLNIASQIIERHSGHIELASQEKEGTTFRVKLRPA